MNYTIRNIFGVAAAIIVLLSLNVVTTNYLSNNNGEEPEPVLTNSEIRTAENRPVSTLKDLNDEIVDIAEKTNPAVVTITTRKTEEVRMRDPFSEFFGFPNQRGDDNTREYVRRGLGSGVIVSEEGYLITNNHVIDGVDEIIVRLYNGDEVNAEVLGTDPDTDIAVLKVEVEDVPTAKIGNSANLKVGSFVLAIGSPLTADLAHTVSFGIISAKERSLDKLTVYGNYIQTDAAINPGNSGGALIDMNGELVGINSAIASRSGGNEGIGFAIPIDLAKRIMDDLVEDGKVSRGYLGMHMAGEVDQTMARALGLKDARGIIVGRLEEDGPAAKAGLQEQDIIVSVNNERIKSWSSFRTKIASQKPNDEIDLGILRDGKSKTISITLGEMPDQSTASVTPERSETLDGKMGFTVTELNSEIRRQLKLENNVEGIIVSKIKESSNAYRRGLRQYDVITAVKKQKVTTSDQFYKELEDAVKEGDEVVLLTVMRQGLNQFIAFEL